MFDVSWHILSQLLHVIYTPLTDVREATTCQETGKSVQSCIIHTDTIKHVVLCGANTESSTALEINRTAATKDNLEQSAPTLSTDSVFCGCQVGVLQMQLIIIK